VQLDDVFVVNDEPVGVIVLIILRVLIIVVVGVFEIGEVRVPVDEEV